jgi:AraC family transcriptional regulator of adaptative response/methylated-DNA-[protein]-cysteine methyltransferase
MTPSHYRQGGTKEKIHFSLAESSLGPLLVASTEQGICAICLGDDAELLLDELAKQFPAAELVGADADFDKMVAAVVGLVENPSKTVKLPLDIRGTVFQERVWAALVKVPPGQTVSYTELARSLGVPSAARAVARACASNRLAVLVPCHRVVRQDGGLSGYRWGVARKAELLKRERDD